MTSTVEVKPDLEQLTCEVSFETLAEGDPSSGNRRFRMVAYTGAEVSRCYGRAIFDLDGIQMKAKVPILLEHDTSRIAGFASRREVTTKGLELEGTIVVSSADGAKVAELADAGFPWESSIGVAVTSWEEVEAGETAEVNGETVVGPISIARKSRMLETSFVTAGADQNTSAIVLSALAQQKERAMSAQDSRAELGAFLGKFPGNEGLAATRYAEGKSETDVALELAAKDREALAATRAELVELKAAKAKSDAKASELAALKTQAGDPGIGFAGGTADELAGAADPADAFAENLTEQGAWDSSAELRSAYGGSRKGFSSHVAREGLFASVEGF